MKIDESVIDKVLDNKAAPGEARKVAGWFVTEEGRKYLSGRLDREMEELAEEMPEDVRLPSISGMKMKQRFMSEIKRERGRRSVGRKWMWVAAVLLPFVLLSVSLLFLVNRTGIFSETEYAEISVPYGEQMRVILQDGSIVHLNSDSRLRYPKQFGLFNRTVELWGEGYFNVARDENRPFKVDLQGVEVRVIGPRFNAKEYRLVPGESAEYNRQSGKCLISRPDNMEQISAWRSNSLNFYLTPLNEIIKVMERHYDVHFIVKDSTVLKNRFTLSTGKVNASDVLYDLETVSNICFTEVEDGLFEVGTK